MADEELAIASPALESPASEEQQQVETPDTEDEVLETEDADGDESQDDAEEELDDLEFGFKKYQVPKSLKEAVESLRADSTRKTQDASARQKALDAREAEFEERLKVTDAELDDRATMRSIEARLAEYAKLSPEDWAAHRESDMVTTDQHWMNYQLLKEQKAEVQSRLDKLGKERADAAQSDLTKRIQETLEYAQKSTSGLKQDSIPKLVEFAQELGVPEEAIKRNWSPIFADLLHYARIGKMAAEKQKTAPKAVSAGAEQPKPVTSVAPKGAAPKTGLRDDLSIDEWNRRREAQIRARA